MKTVKTESQKDIPVYDLKRFKHVHRVDEVNSKFGYAHLEKEKHVAGFELYSSVGLVGDIGPLKSNFYRFSVTVTGSLDMQIGIEHYRHQPRTVSFTYPH